jgi:hypothetical protein
MPTHDFPVHRKVPMRGFWWTLKLFAGLVLVGCLLSIALAVVDPELTGHAGAWFGVLLLSAGVYWVANARLGAHKATLRLEGCGASAFGRPGGAHARPSPASHWQGDLYVLPAPLLRQGGLCLVLASLSLGIPLALVHRGPLRVWQEGLVLLGALLGLWLCRSAVIGFQNLRHAGYALKLDASGVHFPGLPLVPWTQVTGLALEPPRPDPDRSQCLVLQLRSIPEQPSGLHAFWRAALPGASFSRHSVSLPLPTMRKPNVLLDAGHALWRRHGPMPVDPASPSDLKRKPIR